MYHLVAIRPIDVDQASCCGRTTGMVLSSSPGPDVPTAQGGASLTQTVMTTMAVWSMDTNMTPGSGLATSHSLSSNSRHRTSSLSPLRALFAQWKVLSPGISSRKQLDLVASMKPGESSSFFLPRKKKKEQQKIGKTKTLHPREKRPSDRNVLWLLLSSANHPTSILSDTHFRQMVSRKQPGFPVTTAIFLLLLDGYKKCPRASSASAANLLPRAFRSRSLTTSDRTFHACN